MSNLDNYQIDLTTESGQLEYRVVDSYLVRKAEAQYVDELWQAKPNRLVLIACATSADGRDYDYNVVVEAELVSAKIIN